VVKYYVSVRMILCSLIFYGANIVAHIVIHNIIYNGKCRYKLVRSFVQRIQYSI
jgi:hypothetical protein